MPQPIRLYQKGLVLGYKRSMTTQHVHTSLLKIRGVNSRKEVPFYLGKRVAFIYRGKRAVKGSTIRTIWGRITKAHGNSGAVRAKFAKNLPPKAIGATVRIHLFPSNI